MERARDPIDSAAVRHDDPVVNLSSMFGEARAALEGLDFYRRRQQPGPDTPLGDGQPVVLVPGYMSGDRSLAPLATWLERLGYTPYYGGISANVDCATRTADRLARRITAIGELHGDRVLIVGHSLGGALGRLVATRHPELVRGVVCLGSPLVTLDQVHPLVWASARLMGALGDLGVPGVHTRGCLSGDCCAESRQLLRSPFPADVGFVSIYSRSDGIVDWRACLDPDAEQVEVQSSHIGMALNPGVHRVLAERLANLGDYRVAGAFRVAA
jgi:triacylglycerol lipase